MQAGSEIVPRGIEAYCDELSSERRAILKEIERYSFLKVQLPHMISGSFQGKVLTMLTKLINPKKVLEIGCFTGYATICLAQGMEEGSKLTAIEINEELEAHLLDTFERSGAGKKIELKIGNARAIIPALAGSFDLIFLDADKKFYLDYLNLILPKMKSGSVCHCPFFR